MRKEIITATSQDGLDNCTSVFVFTVYDESIDLVEKIKEAAAAFINTDTGLLEYQHNCKNFNWGDFFSAVPNRFLRPYGFEKDTSDVAQHTVSFDEQLATEGDFHFSDEKWEILKRELFMNGTEALEEFLDNDIDENLEKDSIENMLDEVAGQMPDEELYKFYSKYCLEHQVLCEQRKQQLIKAIDDAEAYIPSSDELEIDFFDDIEISGEHKSGWFACRYDGHSSTLLLEFSDQPLITDDEVLDFDINVADVCDELGIAYCG